MMDSTWLEALMGLGFGTALIGWTLVKLPVVTAFTGFAFSDWGANLTAQALLDKGWRPGIDFTYPYGLLPLAFGRLWFGLLGRTPTAYLAAVLMCQAALGWAIARTLARIRIDRLGWAIAILSLPLLIPPTYPNLAHAFEAVAIAFALSARASDRLDRALAFAVVAVFCKPSLAYALGAWLFLETIFECRSVRRVLRPILPALSALVVLSVVLGVWFGFGALIETLFPIGHARNYAASNYGFFFGAGRDFWLPEGAGLGHYLGTQRGYWILGSVSLLAIVVLRGRRRRFSRSPSDTGQDDVFPRSGAGIPLGDAPASQPRGAQSGSPLLPRTPSASEPSDASAFRVVMLCAFLHTVFVTLLYAGPMSWTYDGFVLLIGLAGLPALRLNGSSVRSRRRGLASEAPATRFGSATVDNLWLNRFGKRGRALFWILALQGVLACRVLPREVWNDWNRARPDARTANLSASMDLAGEWHDALDVCRGRDAVLLSWAGAGELLDPETFGEPVRFFLLPGLEDAPDMDRMSERIRTADVVLFPTAEAQPFAEFLKSTPAFAKPLEDFIPRRTGRYFEIWERVEAPARGADAKK